jgi:hypothetical protein
MVLKRKIKTTLGGTLSSLFPACQESSHKESVGICVGSVDSHPGEHIRVETKSRSDMAECCSPSLRPQQ